MDSFAESVSVEVARYGIETSIVMPGPFTQGTAHFANAEPARDEHVAADYDRIADAVADNGTATESLFAPGVVQDVQAVPTTSSGSSACRTAGGRTAARSTSPTSATSRCRRSPKRSGSDCSAASDSPTSSRRRATRGDDMRPRRHRRRRVAPYAVGA
jgi:hypothetical protein